MDRYLVATALQAVCRTFDSDPAASAAHLRRCVESGHLARHGADELLWLAQEVTRLISQDSSVVEDIYRAAFAHQETSDDATMLSNERLRTLRSTRRQDYESGLRSLGEAYPAFLEGAPVPATRVLIDILSMYASAQYHFDVKEAPGEEFDLDARRAHIVPDHSSSWEMSGIASHDVALEMLAAFDQYLRQVSADPSKAMTRKGILDTICERNHHAILWRHLLLCGTSAPETLGLEIRSLAWAKPILSGPDTSTAAGAFLSSIFTTLSIEDRRRIEEAIMYSGPRKLDHGEEGDRVD